MVMKGVGLHVDTTALFCGWTLEAIPVTSTQYNKLQQYINYRQQYVNPLHNHVCHTYAHAIPVPKMEYAQADMRFSALAAVTVNPE